MFQYLHTAVTVLSGDGNGKDGFTYSSEPSQQECVKMHSTSHLVVETHVTKTFGNFSAVFNQLLSYKQETVTMGGFCSRSKHILLQSNLFLVSSQIQKRMPP